MVGWARRALTGGRRRERWLRELKPCLAELLRALAEDEGKDDEQVGQMGLEKENSMRRRIREP